MDTDTRRAIHVLRRRLYQAEADARFDAALLDIATSHIPRTAIVDLTALAVGTTTKTATWSVPVAGDYRVVIQPVIAAARLGTIFATIAAGTKGATSVDIAILNSSASPLAAGVLDVVIHPA